MRSIKFKAWNGEAMSKPFVPWALIPDSVGGLMDINGFSVMWIGSGWTWLQFTGLFDKNGKEIYFGDILRFADKWEWYKGMYGIKMYFAKGDELKKLKEQYEAEPYEERIVDKIEDYDWLLSSEIQIYWEIIGNIYENPNLY